MADETAFYRDPKQSFWERSSRSLLPVRRFDRPAEGTRPASAGNARSAAAVMLIAFALFTLFDSEGIRHFSRDLPGNAFTDLLVRGGDQWHGLMQRLGPARVGPAVRAAFERLHDLPW